MLYKFKHNRIMYCGQHALKPIPLLSCYFSSLLWACLSLPLFIPARRNVSAIGSPWRLECRLQVRVPFTAGHVCWCNPITTSLCRLFYHQQQKKENNKNNKKKMQICFVTYCTKTSDLFLINIPLSFVQSHHLSSELSFNPKTVTGPGVNASKGEDRHFTRWCWSAGGTHIHDVQLLCVIIYVFHVNYTHQDDSMLLKSLLKPPISFSGLRPASRAAMWSRWWGRVRPHLHPSASAAV